MSNWTRVSATSRRDGAVDFLGQRRSVQSSVVLMVGGSFNGRCPDGKSIQPGSGVLQKPLLHGIYMQEALGAAGLPIGVFLADPWYHA